MQSTVSNKPTSRHAAAGQLRIGIDFGTTNTSAAYFDGRQLQPIVLDPTNDNPQLLRSLIYVNREQQVALGLPAAQTFLAQDTGREVILEEKYVGTIEYTVAQQFKGPLDPDGPITIIQDVTIEDDVGMRGRLLQSIKTGLRAESYTGTTIFGCFYSLQELIAPLLRQVRTQASTQLGSEITAATLGRPVQFVDDPRADQAAEERLREAAYLAGFTSIDFVPEPVAAAAFYLAQVTTPEIILVFDFGGGTLDLTVLRTDGQGNHTFLATHGVLLGGDDLDSAMMRQLVAPHFGVGGAIDTNFDDRPILFPEDLADHLQQWQTIPNLSRPKAQTVIKRALQYSPTPEKFVALETLVMRNYGFALFEQIEGAKRRLSTADQTNVHLAVPGIDLDQPISRRAFNRAINEEVSLAREGVRTVLDQAGASRAAIDAVVTTGGSSVIPIFQKMLTDEFPAAHLVPLDTFSGVTNGLAIRAYESTALGWKMVHLGSNL